MEAAEEAPATNIAADSQARADSTAEASIGARKNIIFTTFHLIY